MKISIWFSCFDFFFSIVLNITTSLCAYKKGILDQPSISIFTTDPVRNPMRCIACLNRPLSVNYKVNSTLFSETQMKLECCFENGFLF